MMMTMVAGCSYDSGPIVSDNNREASMELVRSRDCVVELLSRFLAANAYMPALYFYEYFDDSNVIVRAEKFSFIAFAGHGQKSAGSYDPWLKIVRVAWHHHEEQYDVYGWENPSHNIYGIYMHELLHHIEHTFPDHLLPEGADRPLEHAASWWKIFESWSNAAETCKNKDWPNGIY